MKKLLILLFAGLLAGPLARGSVPEQGETRYRVPPKAPIRVYAFSLKDVRLLDGPFKRAMDLDARYLLDLEPDRLLSRFRECAGLEPKGKIYGGWESRGVSGHILGHYLSACAMMYAASGDERFLERVNYIVDELALCQQAHGNGYVGGIPDAKRIFEEVAAGEIKPSGFGLNGGWVPWYTLHKLYAGLLDAHHYCDSDKASKIVTELADWAVGVTEKLSDEEFQTMLRCEHGGMSEVLAEVYAVTGRQKYLDLAGRFNHRSVIDPLMRREDRLEGLHANTQVPKIIGAARQYELTGTEDLRTAAAFFWEVVTKERSFVNGGNSEGEHFHRKGELWKHLTSRTAETCNTYNMLKLTRHLFAWTADRQYADYYERALYNHILASQDPKTGMTIYFCSLKPGHFHTYSEPYESFWCCTGSGLENHVKYGEGIYFHDGASLYVNLFIASELTWKAKGLKVRQQTRFPEEARTRLVVSCEKPIRLALKIRHPYWATSALQVTVNGQKSDADGRESGYLTVDRSWHDGDVVDVTLPMSLRVEPMENSPQRAAIMYGPIVLAGQLGREGFTDDMPYSGNQRAYENLPTPQVPVLVTDNQPVEEWLERVAGKALQFKTVGVGRPKDVSLIPFHQAHHQRFTVYWDLLTEKDWRQKQAEQEAAQRRMKELQARTVDQLVPEGQPERDHNCQGERSSAGMFGGRHWRHAYPGGWFSYEMKVVPDRLVDLMVTYWGSDTGNRRFDVQIDGRKIATQTLNMQKPGEFFDVTYPIPEDLTKNKDKVTVRFQSHPGAMAGGVFGCRIVKRAAKPSDAGALALGLACLGIHGVATSAESKEAEEKPAGSFEIPAWTFDRGNARVDANPAQYADYRDTYPELIAGDGGQLPWVVEYDVEVPVDATYTLHVRYASAEPRPMQLWLDGRKIGECCGNVTGNSLPYPYRRPKVHDAQPRPASDRHGAEWEEAGRLSIAKGKHTLKLTQSATPPNVIALRLDSPVAFPKQWKPASCDMLLPQNQGGERARYELGWDQVGQRAKVNMIPPVYRTGYLPPGSVNVATLRLAIKDVIEEFGPRYPKGSEYLKRLAELEQKQNAAMHGSPEETQVIEDALKSLRREAMLAHPLLSFERLLFVKRMTYSSSHIYSDHWDGSRTMGGNLCVLSPVAPDGTVAEVAPQLAGGLFGRFDLSFDAKKVVFAYKRAENQGYRIYEINVDGTGLRQLTFDAPEEAELMEHYGERFRYEDCDPCYLPDGKIMFASTRSQRRVFCFGSTVTTLYVMDADGKNLRCVSGGPVNEMTPCVMDDGRVIYTRWEYVDKGFGNVQSLWAMRPDGSASAHVYKNDVILPAGMINARSIPGSQRIVTVAAPHCGLSVGPVVLVDSRLNRRTAEAMTNITPELGYPGMSHHRSGRTFGYFKEPYPLSEKLFLVAYNPHPRDHEPTGYGIYVLDAWGNRAELYRDQETSSFQPTPLRPRRTPTEIPPVARMEKTTAETNETKEGELATLFMQDVYRGLTGIERGRVKYLRVMEAIGVSWNDGWRSGQQGDGAGLQASAVSLRADVNIKKIHGVATVHDDGSAHFAVPAERNLFFQALDENYMELQRMRTFVNLMPGETRSCIGCHERRKWAPQLTSASPLALNHPAEALSPQPGDTGPRTVHYAVDVRPILDRHCIGCHSSQEPGQPPAGELDLSGELTKLYDRSYESLIDKGLVSHLNDGYGSANVAPELPLTFGSHRSKLVERIRHDPCRAKLTREEFIRIVTWIDANVPYYGTHEGKKNLKWKDDPHFRPLPLAGK